MDPGLLRERVKAMYEVVGDNSDGFAGALYDFLGGSLSGEPELALKIFRKWLQGYRKHVVNRMQCLMIKRKLNVKVWLDDVREEPEGWVRTTTVKETIKALELFDVQELSLDHDLGELEEPGIRVLDWLEERLLVQEILPPPVIHVHSQNPTGAKVMRKIVYKLEKHALALRVQRGEK
jgi:hypothetical protein